MFNSSRCPRQSRVSAGTTPPICWKLWLKRLIESLERRYSDGDQEQAQATLNEIPVDGLERNILRVLDKNIGR